MLYEALLADQLLCKNLSFNLDRNIFPYLKEYLLMCYNCFDAIFTKLSLIYILQFHTQIIRSKTSMPIFFLGPSYSVLAPLKQLGPNL